MALLSMTSLNPEEGRRRRKAYRESASDQEAAGKLGLLPTTFWRWRKREGLPRLSDPTASRLSPQEHRRRRQVHDSSPGDRDAARTLGLSTSTFQTWRRQQGLPSKRPPGHWLEPREHQRRLDAYRTTRSDAEGANQVGIHREAFRDWRRCHHLPRRNDPAAPRLRPEDRRRRLRLHRSGLNDVQIAARVGVTPDAVTRWRHRRGLKPNRPRWLSPTEAKRRLRLYALGSSDRAASRRLGLQLPAFRAWRYRRGLRSRQLLVPRLTPREHRRRYAVYRTSSSESEAARRLGIFSGTFRMWRLLNDLPPLRPRGPSLSAREERRRRRLYLLSPSDAAAARRIGLSMTAYLYWRISREVPPRRRKARGRLPLGRRTEV